MLLVSRFGIVDVMEENRPAIKLLTKHRTGRNDKGKLLSLCLWAKYGYAAGRRERGWGRA